jgi:hypothetical protein
MYETPVFRIRPGVSEMRWDCWPRVDDAIASYQVFRALRADGVIPAGLRFQVGLPFPVSALNGLRADFGADYPVAAPGYADLVAREIERLTVNIPPGDLAIQWDIAYETLDIEGVLSWTPAGGWERFAERSLSGRCTRRGTWAFRLRRRAVLRVPRPAGQHPGAGHRRAPRRRPRRPAPLTGAKGTNVPAIMPGRPCPEVLVASEHERGGDDEDHG